MNAEHLRDALGCGSHDKDIDQDLELRRDDNIDLAVGDGRILGATSDATGCFDHATSRGLALSCFPAASIDLHFSARIAVASRSSV